MKKFFNKNIYQVGLMSAAMLALPQFVFAQSETLYTVIGRLIAIADATIPLIIGVAVVFLLWGIFKYVFSTGDVQQAEARGVMSYGIFALFVMVSVWGLVRIVASFFGEDITNAQVNVEQHNTSDFLRYID